MEQQWTYMLLCSIWFASHPREISQVHFGVCVCRYMYMCMYLHTHTTSLVHVYTHQKSVSLFSVIFAPVRDFIKEIEAAMCLQG